MRRFVTAVVLIQAVAAPITGCKARKDATALKAQETQVAVDRRLAGEALRDLGRGAKALEAVAKDPARLDAHRKATIDALKRQAQTVKTYFERFEANRGEGDAVAVGEAEYAHLIWLLRENLGVLYVPYSGDEKLTEQQRLDLGAKLSRGRSDADEMLSLLSSWTDASPQTSYLAAFARITSEPPAKLPQESALSAQIRAAFDPGRAPESFSPEDCGGGMLDANVQQYNRNATPGLADDRCVGYGLLQALMTSPDLASFFAGPTGVSEGYDLYRHTIKVLQIFATQRRHYEMDLQEPLPGSQHAVADLLPLILALHDLGKPAAVEKGDKNLQHEFTTPLLKALLPAMGYDRAATSLAVALVDNDLLGDVLKASRGQPLTDDALSYVVGELSGLAASAGLSLDRYARLQTLYYVSDAASYPFLYHNVFANCGEGRLCAKSGGLDQILEAARGSKG